MIIELPGRWEVSNVTSGKAKRRGRAPHPQNRRPARKRRRRGRNEAPLSPGLLAVMILSFCVLAGLVWLFDLVVGYHPILP